LLSGVWVMTSASIDTLEAAAAGGDASAKRELGKLALIGQAGARSTHNGALLLVAAAEAGDAEADAVISVLIGADAKEPADWDLALDYLGRAARRGWEPACKQLALLCADRDLVKRSETEPFSAETWRAIRDRVDIAALIKPAPPRIMFEAPDIRIIERFASPQECAWMIARARPRIARAVVFDQQSGGKKIEDTRTNSMVMFNILDADFVLVMLHARIAAAAGVTARHLEETNVLHYAVGQQFSRHFDFFNPERAALQREIEGTGQRAATFLIYLNEDFEGGETEFAKLDWRYKGAPGDALLFRNVDPAGAPDLQTLHAGLAPTRGEKWLLSQWIRSRTPRRPDEKQITAL